MDIFFKDNLNSSDQLYIEQLGASMALPQIIPIPVSRQRLQIYWMLTAGGL